jgi:hypothetical protein
VIALMMEAVRTSTSRDDSAPSQNAAISAVD